MGIFSGRTFQLWSYSVSHGNALVRSPSNLEFDTNVDIMFGAVDYLVLTPGIGEVLEIGSASVEEVVDLREILGYVFPEEWARVIVTPKQRFRVVATQMIVRESTMGIFESPFDPPHKF